ncbi:MAG: hypothetical protein HY583_00730 [Candidatus Omnitrophica bacterium]|nr:hypothetical protein [Candidatus Omnitrophota bacterium]
MIKKIVLVIGVLFLILLGFILTNSFWLRYALAAGISQVTGFPTKIHKTDLNIQKSLFGIYGLRIRNPSGFPRSTFISIPEVFVDFDLGPFIKSRKLYIRQLRLHIEEVSIIRNQSGETNISRLTTVKKGKAERETQKLEKAKSPKELKFFVETFVLTIRRVRFQDQTNPLIGEKVIDLHIEQEVIHGLSSPADIVRLVVLRVIQKAALGNLGVPIDLLSQQLDASIAKGEELVNQSVALAAKMGTQTIGEGERILGEASKKVPIPTEEVGQVVEEAKTKLKDILGKAKSSVSSN